MFNLPRLLSGGRSSSGDGAARGEARPRLEQNEGVLALDNRREINVADMDRISLQVLLPGDPPIPAIGDWSVRGNVAIFTMRNLNAAPPLPALPDEAPAWDPLALDDNAPAAEPPRPGSAARAVGALGRAVAAAGAAVGGAADEAIYAVDEAAAMVQGRNEGPVVRATRRAFMASLGLVQEPDEGEARNIEELPPPGTSYRGWGARYFQIEHVRAGRVRIRRDAESPWIDFTKGEVQLLVDIFRYDVQNRNLTEEERGERPQPFAEVVQEADGSWSIIFRAITDEDENIAPLQQWGTLYGSGARSRASSPFDQRKAATMAHKMAHKAGFTRSFPDFPDPAHQPHRNCGCRQPCPLNRLRVANKFTMEGFSPALVRTLAVWYNVEIRTSEGLNNGP
ncbi:hypothetical protein ACHAXT_003358 [Thalassiosira profunda]